ncbi:MAG: isocitrate/isopropylmalate dehydrogenase family protein [Gammaproteobacteria bacterium]
MSHSSHHIAVLPGDGVGTEVMAATLKVLEAALARTGVPLDWDELPWPSTAWHREHGAMMPEDGLEQLQKYDAILLGALGDPGPLSDPERYVLPDSISLSPLLAIRKGFDLWACERPAQLLKGAPRFLADPRAAEIDMLVIRENSEGEYVGQGGRLHRDTPAEVATQVEVFTRFAAERVIRHAFRRAQQRLEERHRGLRRERMFNDDRGGEKAAQVCLVTKRNALQYWGDMYTDIFAEIAAGFPDIAIHHELIDAACMKFVQCPWRFDVVVASNLHGDILTDLAAVLSGGMGVAPSCNINPDNRDHPPMFEPTHGSAPDIAGESRADPRAMILTAVMMLEWLAESEPRYSEPAAAMRHAVEEDLANQSQADRSTTTIADSVIANLD